MIGTYLSDANQKVYRHLTKHTFLFVGEDSCNIIHKLVILSNEALFNYYLQVPQICHVGPRTWNGSLQGVILYSINIAQQLVCNPKISVKIRLV